ncbi:MAG: tetratricopeptide repeat protein [Acidobacteria bacterium]|nr:tetratricopeptide repeat protein [Acidobacteriota bacterium]
MKLSEKPVYLLAGLEVDPARNCLRRAGAEQVLRQKSFRVLLYLVEHRERLVTKEELLQNVWEGTAVTDDALVQIIVELRKVLGDDSRQPRFIRTIPKAGYHFIGPVEELSASSIQLGQSTVIEIEETASVQVEFEETLAPTPALPSPRWFNRKPVLLASLGSGLVIAVLTLLSFSQRPAARTEIALPHMPGKRTVAVLYFENQSGDRELDWLREGLTDMLITNLSRSRTLTLLSRQQLAALLGHIGQQNAVKLNLEDGLEIGRRAQAEMLILGRFARLGEQVRIDVSLHEARTGQLQAAEALVAERPELILGQLDLLALKLAQHLGATPAQEEASGGGLATVMTSNLDAYRYYSLALEQAQMYQFNEAIALLEKALALDPQFALAYARIGHIYAVRMGQGEKARPYLEKALQLNEQLPGRLSERDKLYIAAWSANASYDPERAIATYRELLARYPLETEAYQRLGWVLQRLDRNEEALQVIRQGLVTDPDEKDLYNALGGVCARLGRNDEALAAFQRYIQLTPNDPNAWDSLGGFHQLLGQYEPAAAAYSRALALNPESRIAIIHLGTLYVRQGRYRAAIEQFQRHFQIARDDNQRARSFQYTAAVYLKQSDLPRAAAAIKEEVKYGPDSLWNSLVLALAHGEQTAAQKLNAAIFTPANYNLNNERGFLRHWNYQRGYVALKQGRTDEAINHFRAAVRQWPLEWNYDSYEDCLANAYLELGRTDEAIAEYERILKINPHYPLAQYHLGQAYERKGERAQARAAYERFLQVWQAADADIPEVLKAKTWLANSQ